jgi:hypothetical protein
VPSASVHDIQINPATNKTVIFTTAAAPSSSFAELADSGDQTPR